MENKASDVGKGQGTPVPAEEGDASNLCPTDALGTQGQTPHHRVNTVLE